MPALTMKGHLYRARRRRVKILMKRIKKHGEHYIPRRGRPPLALHNGPCVPTVVKIKGRKPRGILDRLLRRNKMAGQRLVSGRGHILASFDRYGNRMWHPRYADVKICLVCREVQVRQHGTKPGAS